MKSERQTTSLCTPRKTEGAQLEENLLRVHAGESTRAGGGPDSFQHYDLESYLAHRI